MACEGAMLRVAAAVYLMIVTAVGPAACCCTLSRLAHRVAEKHPAPAPAPCCCHGSGEPAPAEVPVHPCSPERQDSPGCPCKQAGCEVVGLPAAHDEALEPPARAFGEAFSALAFLPPQCDPLTFAAPVFRESALRGPSVSTDDLLYAFHILRC